LAVAALAACSNDIFGSPDASDDASPADGAVDGGGGPEACTSGLACSGTQAACVTFDPNEGPFTDQSLSPGSTSISTDEYVTCPSSLLSDLPTTGASVGKAIVSHDFTETGQSANITVDLSVWLPANANGAFSALAVRIGDMDVVQLASSAGSWFLRVLASGESRSIQPVLGAWNHMVLQVVFSNDTNIGEASLTYDADGGARPTAIIKDRTTSSIAITTITADLGLQGTTTAAMKAYYDDVIVTL
jgi:hypothetical protein